MAVYKVIHTIPTSELSCTTSRPAFIRLEGSVQLECPHKPLNELEENLYWESKIAEVCSMALFIQTESSSVLTEKYGLKGSFNWKKVFPNATNPRNAVTFQMFYDYSKPLLSSSSPAAVTPSLYFDDWKNPGDTKPATRHKRLTFIVDSLFCVSSEEVSTEYSALYITFVRKVKDYLQWCVDKWRQTQSKSQSSYTLRGYHYFLKDINDTVLTILYPIKSFDWLEEESLRKQIHFELNLPGDWPRFRRIQALSFGKRIFTKLVSPHLLMKPLQICSETTSMHFIRGEYLYAHYRQDGENDDSWGCAYRSLQTLLSWYHMAGYITLNEMPSLKKIQQILVDLKDKPSKFVGSREWIGSVEVSLCLQHICQQNQRQNPNGDQIPSPRLQYVANGTEMKDQVQMLARHFDDEGSPVMIGGGLLAHTIIGVMLPKGDSNTKVKFLILDPHYTGSDDDLKTIFDKGWISWKEASFWDPKAYYNMCLPLRPRSRL